MNNEQYQRNLEKYNKVKFLNAKNKYFYQGDIVTKMLYKRIKKYIKPNVLDIGAGTGALVRLLKEKGIKIPKVWIYILR